MKMQNVFMQLTGAIVVGGEVLRKGEIVEVSAAEAANLARRGKAVPATAGEPDEPAEAAETDEAQAGGNRRGNRKQQQTEE
jgi:hypothetical protein